MAVILKMIAIFVPINFSFLGALAKKGRPACFKPSVSFVQFNKLYISEEEKEGLMLAEARVKTSREVLRELLGSGARDKQTQREALLVKKSMAFVISYP